MSLFQIQFDIPINFLWLVILNLLLLIFGKLDTNRADIELFVIDLTRNWFKVKSLLWLFADINRVRRLIDILLCV